MFSAFAHQKRGDNIAVVQEGKFIRDSVILTKRSGGRISRRDIFEMFHFIAFAPTGGELRLYMTRGILDNIYIIAPPKSKNSKKSC